MNKVLNLLLFLSILAVVGIFWMAYNKPTEEIQKIDQSSTRGENRQQVAASKYMKELQYRLKKEELLSLNELKNNGEVKGYLERINRQEINQVPIEQQISKDVPVGVETRSASSSPGASGNAINKDNAADFIATARRNGFHVMLSENYEVISITPIMKANSRRDEYETHPSQ